MGEYLSKNKPWNGEVRQAYIRLFDFTGTAVLPALRTLLLTFRLPGEAAQIDRIMETFATAYFLAQPKVPGEIPNPPEKKPPPSCQKRRNPPSC